ncbi:MAG: hypothetical protein HY040_18470 [Planctomycetes bacterium]|nr:hypothetical protein [Planctomycetota bacterium]
MKRSRMLVLALFAAFWSMTPAAGQEKKEDRKPLYLVNSFYPREPGLQWVYRVFSGKGGQMREERGKVIITAEKTEDLPFKDLGEGGKEVIKSDKDKNQIWVRCTRFKVSDDRGEKTQYEDVGILEEGVYRFRSADKEMVPPLRFFSFDLKNNKTWKVSSRSEEKKVEGTFSADGAMVKVPAGVFENTIHIFAKDFPVGDQKMDVEYWFADKVGMVKQRVKLGDTEMILELEKGPAK